MAAKRLQSILPPFSISEALETTKIWSIAGKLNAKEPLKENPAVESLFWPLDRQEDAGGDRSMSHVFDHKHFDDLERGLQAGVAAGGAAVYCSDKEGWEVLPNELYNVAGYTGLNICWVYNQKIDTWVKKLPADTQALVASKKLKNFPWFSTFEENVPSVIKLRDRKSTRLNSSHSRASRMPSSA